MNAGTIEILDHALDILKVLLQGEEVSKNKNVLLYDKYRYNAAVEEMLIHIADKLELRIYAGSDRLFVCPEAGSRLFGWTNEELRDRISYVTTNSELFTCYFIIMTLVTMFYREAYPDTPVAYVKINELIESVARRLENLGRLPELEKVSEENQFDFTEICKVWQRLPDAREGVSGGKNDKVAFVENVCRFLYNEKLIALDMTQRIIYPTERLKVIIWNYYEDRDNRRDLLSFVRGLEVNADATHQ
ncbi:DUF6063 family protein [Sporomusa acidovorans]|uniref:Uncharacterized protein n=1 Tax=Sporomusa acidovorans (strain ATCC 49682 / DSM 3132 / Mol) TaxID=1123286 RepID=A0ABZ3J7G1_SPOA4|nr:DUF6063 family protein [Sporomusa acidovorans]OZC18548.1 hypothetical protein SPACI_34150 [Sporomusa acidovorans DSM 3132]SDE38081.1 hypothetical protein SAMN04488499_101284 [Sporomusa acidovorans]